MSDPTPTGLPADAVTRPTLSEKHAHVTILDRIVLGWGLRIRCCDCGHETVISASDMLERYWRSADRTTGEFIERMVCKCGSKRIIGQVYNSGHIEGMLSDTLTTLEGRRKVVEAELARRRERADGGI